MARLCIVRQHYVPQDSRVAREMEHLAACGHDVDVLCLRGKGEARKERRGRVTIRRLPLRHTRSGAGRYLFEYAAFFVLASLYVTALFLRRRYRIVQVNSLPDALVFSALIPRLLGARVLLDLQECMPEFFATKFRTGLSHPFVRTLALLEQMSIRFADHVITPTAQMRATFIRRGARPDKITVVMDGSDETVFRSPRSSSQSRFPEGRFTLICHGTVEPQYGLDTVVEAVALLRDEIPGLRFEVYGDGSQLPSLHQLAASLGIEDRVWFSDGFVAITDLVEALDAAQVGVVAMRRDAFRDVTLPGKIFDFIAMSKPVIASRTRSLEEAFGPECFAFFESGSASDLAAAIRTLHADPERGAHLATTAKTVAIPYSWSRQRQIYGGVVSRLLSPAGALREARRHDPNETVAPSPRDRHVPAKGSRL